MWTSPFFRLFCLALCSFKRCRFDYIARDSHHLGVQTSHDAARLINSARVIDDAICYDYKEVYNIYELFHTRYSLHKRIYTHKACILFFDRTKKTTFKESDMKTQGRAIEYMVVDAFVAADEYLGISNMIDNMEDYLYCTDSLLEEIQKSKAPVSALILSKIYIRKLMDVIVGT